MNENLTLKIHDILESRILSNYYEDGFCIKEKKIADEFEVSRTPVREALQLLESDNLIVHNDFNKGYFVKKFSVKDICDIYDLRTILESYSASLCAEKISEEEMLHLNETLILEEFYIKNYNLERIIYYDNKFHDIIHRQSDNVFLERTLNRLHRYTLFFREKSYKSKMRTELSFNEHKQIFLAIQQRNPEAAYNTMKIHIDNAKNYMVENQKN